RVTRAELRPASREIHGLDETVMKLAAARMLVLGEHHNVQTVELAQDALIAGWPRLRSWIEDNREQLVTANRIARAAEEWVAFDRVESRLLGGTRRELAVGWAEEHPAQLNERVASFLQTSRESQKRGSASQAPQTVRRGRSIHVRAAHSDGDRPRRHQSTA